MAKQPAGETVLITGGTDGLGKASALLLAEKGYRVFAAGRSQEKRDRLNAEASARKLPLESVEMDVLSDASVRQAVTGMVAKTGGIDVLVNNAGIGYMAVLEELRMEDLRRQFETNLFAVLRVTQAVLPRMREKCSGRIVMMSSVAGMVTPPTYGAYSSSKHALEGLSNALRLEVHPFGIKVILIEPGYIMTSFQQTARELAEPYLKEPERSPYARVYAGALGGAERGRRGSHTTPEDCARVMLKAIQAANPKPRYPVTRLATFAKWAKRVMSDRAVDAFLRRKYGVPRPL